jgi:hypothetical protein
MTSGLSPGRDEADGDDFDSVREVGLDLIIGEDAGLLGGAHHERDVGAVDVGIDEADALAERASAMARLTARVVLPTPPLPDPMATMDLTPGRAVGGGGDPG